MFGRSKPHVFRIDFTPANGVYYAGQLVSGHVVIGTQTEIKDVKGLKLKFHGCGEVSWSETRNVTKSRITPRGETKIETVPETVRYHSSEVYFENRTYLFGGGGSKSTLSPGSHTLPFAFQLPVTIPSSCENEHGRVRYTVKAELESGWMPSKAEAAFAVVGILDLNLAPETMSPIHKSSHKHLGYLFWKTGPISASIHLPKTGFIPGESIPVTAEIDNKANREMKKTYANLIQTITYKAQGHYKERSKVIATTKRGTIAANGEDVWSNVPLVIPIVPPSKLGYCSIMEIEYVIEFGVEPSGIGLDLKMQLPITIGTIPNYGQQPAFNPSAPQANQMYPQLPQMSATTFGGPDNFVQVLPGAANQIPIDAPPTYDSVFGLPTEKPIEKKEKCEEESSWEFA